MITGLNHITLAMRDLDESFRFYRDVLKFKPLMRAKRIAYFLAGDLWFCLDEDPSTRSGPLPEYTHFAFSVTAHNFTRISEIIRASGAELWKTNESEGDSLYFLDPNGHKLEIHVGDWKTRLEATKLDPWEDGIVFFV